MPIPVFKDETFKRYEGSVTTFPEYWKSLRTMASGGARVTVFVSYAVAE